MNELTAVPNRVSAIDARYIKNPLSGIGRYTLNLLRGITQIQPGCKIFVLVCGSTVLPEDLDRAATFEVVHVPWGPQNIRSQWAIPAVLRRLGVELLHCPDVFAPLMWPGRMILTIHDLIPIACRDLLHSSTKSRLHRIWKVWVQMQCHRANAVLTVSEYSAGDLVRWLNIPREKVHIIHNGIELGAALTLELQQDVRARFDLPGRIILYVGRRDPTKNLACLVRAYEQVRARLEEPVHLVLVGQPDSRYREAEQEAQRMGVTDGIVYTGHLDDQYLAAFYREADVFAFPSLYEGFGLPPLEAMRFGTPVVASNRTSLPEVLGDAAVFVDATSNIALSEGLYRVLTDRALSRELGERGRTRSEWFGIKRQAEETLSLYEQILQTPLSTRRGAK
jgi:glycosyltransferase involved in cell wall biosynthesis